MATIGDQLTAPEAGWKRYDNRYPSIAYNGTWAKRTGYAGSYELTDTYTSTAGDTATFDFVGTKIRIISFFWNNFTADAKITIDGVAHTFSERSASNTPQVIVFEKMGLSEGKHRVELKLNSGTDYFGIDAIDIDDTGSIEFPIGFQLTAPAQGWKRYDDSDPSIKYFGTFVRESNVGFYGGASNYATSADFKIKFNFIGTKIRIIGNLYQNKFPNVPITIDGVTETFSQYGDLKFQALQYEKIGLENKKHTVEITVPSYAGSIGFDPKNMNVRNIQMDAIDIDSNGRLLHPDEVTYLNDLQVGKRIRANYIASNNLFGTVSGLGEESKELLPIAPTTAPNGDFYFIMADTDHRGGKILISDRNIQSGISMDVLHSAGIASGSGLPSIISDYKDTFLVGGGASASHNTISINGAGGVRTDRGVTSGKWYWEAFVLGSSNTHIGIATSNVALSNPVSTGAAVRSYAGSGLKWNGSSVSYGSTYTNGDVIGIGLDMDAGTLTFYKNGVSQETAFTDLKSLGTVYPLFFSGSSSDNLKAAFNFGYSPFKYEVPLGYSTLVSTPTHAFSLRLLTGGISPNDKDNEWDKHMTDDRIWNNVNHGSWTSTTDQSNPKARVIRGYNGLTNWTSGTTNLTTPGRGFRPVLLIEPISNNRFLVLDGTDVKTYTSSGWETVGTTPPNDDMFLNKGMLDLSTCAPYLKDLIDKSNIKILVSKPKREPTVAHLTGIPVPRIVKMNNDVSFLNTSKINSLTLSGTEKGVLRVAISTDSGTTWEATQKNGSWTTVDITNPIDFKAKAMTIDDFNSISEWDEKIGQARNLRCAFYFEQSSSTDEASLDSLTMDVDLLDSWDMAMPGVDYKYGYNRNTNLRVLLLSDGDYKINIGFGGSSGSMITEVDGGIF
ncbi:SPRY domain-containing protein [Brevibacillus brevis]|uniref:SPRY domain-containing protein n=1 Tax=Brevibacillus brevis TaxID=1393 RepID=UPI0007D8C718|nr:SPRY domain-containing protein [Brevibacillus brevis]